MSKLFVFWIRANDLRANETIDKSESKANRSSDWKSY